MVPARCRAKFARSSADLGANTVNIHPLYCSMHTVDNTLYTGIVGIALPTQVRLAGVHYTVQYTVIHSKVRTVVQGKFYCKD